MKCDNNNKTPVTHPWMIRQIAAGFLICKIVSDLQIIFYICELVCNVPIVLVASATDAIGPQERYGKIKLLDFSVHGLRILSEIDICISS